MQKHFRSEETWIGLEQVSGSTFQWSDGTPTTFLNWKDDNGRNEIIVTHQRHSSLSSHIYL